MNIVQISVLLLLTYQTQALRCRSGNQETNEEMKKIMQTCKRRYSTTKGDDENSSASDSDESDDDNSASDGSIFEQDFFSNSKKSQDSGNNDNRNNSYSHSSYNGTRHSGSERRNYRSAQYNRETDVRTQYGNSAYYSPGSRNTRNRNSSYGMQYDSNSNSNNNSSNNSGVNDSDKQSCSIQCFFDELGLVDHRGYPERIAVTRIMAHGIQDPQLRDFVEESILECFHFIMSTMNLDKCAFSQNLLNCFADKGRERCEDWND